MHTMPATRGASTDVRHTTLQTIAGREADAGIATFRYNSPYAEHGPGRDSQATCTTTVRAAVAAAQGRSPTSLSWPAATPSAGG